MPTRRPAAWAAASAANTTRRLPSRPTNMSGVSGGGAASVAFRLTRSVDKVGRKTEMTLVIARLQFEICALAGAATDQLNQPAGPTDSRHRERGGGQHRYAPARRGGGGLPKSDASVWRRQRRSAMPMVPEPSAASWSRREAVIDNRVTSATTAPRPPWRRPSSKQARTVFSSPPSR